MSITIVHTTTFLGNASPPYNNGTITLSAQATAGNFLIVFSLSKFMGPVDIVTDEAQQMTGISSINTVTNQLLIEALCSADGFDNPIPLTSNVNSLTFTSSAGQVVEPVIIYEVAGIGLTVSSAFDTHTLSLVASFAGASMTPPATALIFSAIGSGVNMSAVVPTIGVSGGWALDLASNIALEIWGLGVAHQIASGTKQATFSLSPNDIALCPGFYITEGPDFSLSAAPASLSVAQGQSGTDTITVTSINSYNSAVTLSTLGLPTGVTAAFSPNPVTPPANSTVTSMLTLTVAANAAVGASTITISGTDGTLTHTTTLTLTVTSAVKAGILAVYSEGNTISSLLMGTTTGILAQTGGAVDLGNQNISCVVRTGSYDQGQPLNMKEYGNVIFDLDPGGATDAFPVIITPYINGEAAVESSIAVTGSGRQQVPLDLSDVYAFNMEFEIAWTRNAAINPIIYQLDILYRVEPAAVKHWETRESSLGQVGFQHVRDLYVAIRSTADVTLQVMADGVPVNYTLPSTAGLRRKLFLGMTSNKGKLYRFVFDSAQEFRIYADDCETRAKPWLGLLGYSVRSAFGEEGAGQ